MNPLGLNRSILYKGAFNNVHGLSHDDAFSSTSRSLWRVI
jgi:hypothetical protein